MFCLKTFYRRILMKKQCKINFHRLIIPKSAAHVLIVSMYDAITDHINRCMHDWGLIVATHKLIIVIKVLALKIS